MLGETLASTSRELRETVAWEDRPGKPAPSPTPESTSRERGGMLGETLASTSRELRETVAWEDRPGKPAPSPTPASTSRERAGTFAGEPGLVAAGELIGTRPRIRYRPLSQMKL